LSRILRISYTITERLANKSPRVGRFESFQECARIVEICRRPRDCREEVYHFAAHAAELLRRLNGLWSITHSISIINVSIVRREVVMGICERMIDTLKRE